MQEKSPIVSVLMTVYNREKYIAEAIDSVLSSTYGNYELIIVDDCSIDKSVEIMREYEKADDRIRVYINKNNLGDYPNRNKAASLARGKYLKYVDADDMIYPHGLEILVESMEQFPEAGYGLCSLDQDAERIFPFMLFPRMAYRRHYFEQPLFHKAPLSSIIKRDAFNAVGGFSGKQHVGDYEMWHLLSQKFPVVLMPHGIVWYREHDDQQKNDNRTDYKVPFKYIQLVLELLNSGKTPLEEDELIRALKYIKKRQSRYILRNIKNNGWRAGVELMNIGNITVSNVLRNAFMD